MNNITPQQRSFLSNYLRNVYIRKPPPPRVCTYTKRLGCIRTIVNCLYTTYIIVNTQNWNTKNEQPKNCTIDAIIIIDPDILTLLVSYATKTSGNIC